MTAPAAGLVAVTATAAATRDLAAAVSGLCRAGDTVLLSGGLGAGKTTFAQGFARGLGVAGPVTSPTFTLVRQYPCRGPGGVRQLLHADVYRLDHLSEVVELALPELTEADGVALVEWGDAVAPALGPGALRVSLERQPGEGADEARRVVVVPGEPWADRAAALAAALAPFAAVPA